MRHSPLYLIAPCVILLLAGCEDVSQKTSAINTTRINIPLSTMEDHAVEAQHTALIRAAQTTLARGFDRFIIDPDQVIKGGNQAIRGAGAGESGSGNGGYSERAHPRKIMIIQMLHNGDARADSALDARAVLAAGGAY